MIKCPWLDDNKAIERLCNEWKEHNGIIIGFDYDSTVFDYHKQGYDYSDIINLLVECKQMGCTLVLQTSSPPWRNPEIVLHCESIGIAPDYINATPPCIPFGQEIGVKPYCNIHIDDRSGLSSAIHILTETVNAIKGIKPPSPQA